MNPLGILESVNIREVWQGEASHFTRNHSGSSNGSKHSGRADIPQKIRGTTRRKFKK
jgi:hypothetical protein